MSAEILKIDDLDVLTYTDSNGRLYQLSSVYHKDYYQKIWAKEHLSNYRNPVYILFGLGDGSYLRALIEQADENSRFIIYEPSSEIYEVARTNWDLDQLLDRKKLLFINNASPQSLPNLISPLFTSLDTNGIKVCCYPNYAHIFPDLKSEFETVIRNIIRAKVSSQITLSKKGQTVTYNMLKNIPILANSFAISDIKTVISPDIPVIICGAGPSLNDAIPYLSQAKGHALILCVDSALPALLRNNIIPDLMVSVDPIKEDYNFRDPRVKDIPGVFPMACRNFIFDDRSATNFFYNCTSPFITLIGNKFNMDLPNLDANTSVGNHAFSIAKYIGSKVILLTGIDMAFKDNRTHAQGTLLADEDANARPDLIEVQGVNGEMLLSDGPMNMYRILLEDSIYNSDATVINTSSCGALFKGTINLPFIDALSKYCQSDVYFDFNSLHSISRDYHTLLNDIVKRQKDFVNSIIPTLSHMKQLIKENNITSSEGDILIPACYETLTYILSDSSLCPILYSSICYCSKTLETINEKTDINTCFSKFIDIFDAILTGAEYAMELEAMP